MALLIGLLRRAVALGEVARGICTPWLSLAARVWLGQVVLVGRIMTMMAAPDGGHPAAAALEAMTLSAGPLLLALGLATRPVALAILAEAALGDRADGLAATVTLPEAALLAWLVVAGPGALSLDHLLRRGLARFPSAAVRLARRLYAWTDRIGGPPLRLALRIGLAAAIVGPVASAFAPGSLALPAWCAVPIAAALVLGLATRPAALALAGTVPLAGAAMAMDDRLSVLLLLLMLAASGAGALSVDHLLARRARTWMKRAGAAPESLPRVVVVRGGFGGVAAALGLRGAACRVTLIDRRNHHLFQPLLYQVATAALSPGEIATPIRSLFRGQDNVRVRLGEVTGVDLAAREVLLGAARVPFDVLVLATGARHGYFGRDEWAPFAPGLKGIDDATAIRSRLLRAFEEAENAGDDGAERAAWLTFVVVGGGPTGIELAGAIAELARHGMGDEYRGIDPAAARVVLVQSGPRVLPAFPPALSAAAERSLRDLGVDVRLGARVTGIDGAGVEAGGRRIAARTVLWAAGVAASPAAQWVGRAGDASGRLVVEADLSVPGLRGVAYAIGDTAACEAGWRGKPVPGLAPAAKQQGQYVARAIGAALAGRPPPPPFRYRHFGNLATIGRRAAVAELGPIRAWGAPAWWFWGAAHIAFLAGGRNRATVLLDWAWAYLTYRRSARLITAAMPDPAQ